MIIQYEEFKIIPQEHGYDLIEVVKAKKIGEGTIQDPQGEEYEKDIELAYNIRLEYAIDRIIHLKLKKQNSIVDLTKFIEEYKREKAKISSLLS